ncbi:MAG: leucyl aminopeptidase [Geminicoccaceae bacterium]
MIELKFTAGELPASGTLVVGIAAPSGLGAVATSLDKKSKGLVRKALDQAGGLKHGKFLELVLPRGLDLDRLLLVGIGKPDGLSRLEREELGARIARKLEALGVEAAVLAPLDGLELGTGAATAAAELALGAKLASYAFRKYQTPEKDEPKRLGRLTLNLTEAPGDDLAAPVEAQAAAVALTRDLVSEPANVLYPESFAERCRELGKLGVEVEVLGEAELEKLGMRALLGVAQGSVRQPRVVVMRWRGADQAKPLVLVGKGVCFDTGGISIKPSGGMEEMKWDMAGAGAVVGAMHAVAGRKAKAHVVGIIGLVENMPSGTAQRPGDVVKAMSGKTIEVINTDAEGRLVLADVLHYAKEQLDPAAMVDLATLTGAVIVALGHENAGLFANNEKLAGNLAKAAEAVGEGLWRLPLGKAYTKHIKSQIADIKNVGRGREAGATAGAVFLEEFVGELPWAHLDIAGVAWSSREQPLAAKGATGFGVRLLDELVRQAYEADA